jgi:DNA ligase-associated metallophosphoesterase
MHFLSIELRGEEMWLLPERAVYWPRTGALVIADPHFGKAAAFRAGGIPVPGGTTAEMLHRLDAALDRTGAARLLVLGDLLHARAGRVPHTLETVAAWRAARPGLRVALVRGNHDRRAGDPPAEWRVECLDAPVAEPPFLWLHEPPDPVAQAFLPALPALQGYPVAGHVHPAVALGGNGRGLTLPCFYFGRAYGLLPSFGEFTGTAVVRPRPGEGVFVLAGDEVIAKQIPRS